MECAKGIARDVRRACATAALACIVAAVTLSLSVSFFAAIATASFPSILVLSSWERAFVTILLSCVFQDVYSADEVNQAPDRSAELALSSQCHLTWHRTNLTPDCHGTAGELRCSLPLQPVLPGSSTFQVENAYFLVTSRAWSLCLNFAFYEF